MGYADPLASHCSCSSGKNGIMVMYPCSSFAVFEWVSSLRVPTHMIVQPIIQRNNARGSNNSLISRLRTLVFHLSFLGRRLCRVLEGL